MSVWLEIRKLEGRCITLEPVTQSHYEGLKAATEAADIWRFMPFHVGRNYDRFFDHALEETEKGTSLVYAVRRLSDDRIVGSTRFLNIDPTHKRAEIGFTWYVPDAQGTGVNPDAKYLLLEFAFASGANRVEFKTDARNARSRAALLKLGAREEGTLRRHMVLWDGHIRDSVYFSVLPEEWPELSARLDERRSGPA